MKKIFISGLAAITLQTGLFGICAQKNQTIEPTLLAPSHKARQVRPIQLGVSGGSTIDMSNGYCCSGTLGALVKDRSGTFYILSNTHVLAGDSVAGKNGKVSSKGDPINQPGFIDINCILKPSDYVAYLTDWNVLIPYGTSSVDAAIAAIVPGAVDTQGKILEIGPISRTPRNAFINQNVKKSGRTSGLTRGRIYAINATVSVQYGTECAGEPFTTTFKDQILITPGKFLSPGDSGSLMVEDVASKPRPIGLLFAGSSTIAVANPIQKVLDRFDVTIVGSASSSAEDKTSFAERTLSAGISKVQKVKERHSSTLMEIDGVVGHAIGVSKTDQTTPVILLLVSEKTEGLAEIIPRHIEGVAIEIVETGAFQAY